MEDNRGFALSGLSYEEENIDDENEEDWSSVCGNQTKRRNSGCGIYASGAANSPAKKKLKTQLFGPFEEARANHTKNEPSDDVLQSAKGHERTIIHFDIDCFYAQVEMILNPSLSNQPVGIQQKHIIVTCNYIARERGLKKLMRLSEAKKQCPDLVIVNGEDLTKYRDFSKKVNDLLLEITPNVERLGFDENFLDVTNIVEARMKDKTYGNCMVTGFVYGDKETNNEAVEICSCGCHQRLTIGSHLAHEIREMIYDQTGLTCCAGIAHNKMLAKLAGECHKPNKQTVLFPENIDSFMQRLPARKIPGVGSSSAKRLQSIGITSIVELKSCSLEAIQAEFGDGPFALQLKRWGHGIDDANVVPSGSPKSISEEDTYHECSSISDVTKNLKGLSEKLVSRLTDDIGMPQTVRLTIRRGIGELAADRKESRQCPLPSKFSSPGLTQANRNEILLNSTLELFKKLMNIKQPFKIKLLNVCLTKFQKQAKKEKTGLSNFLLNCHNSKPGCSNSSFGNSSEQKSDIVQTLSKPLNSGENNHCKDSLDDQNEQILETLQMSEKSKKLPFGVQQQVDGLSQQTYKETLLPKTKVSDDKKLTGNDVVIPSTIDKDIFNSLPAELQKELLEEWKLSNQQKKNQKPKPATGLLKYFSKN